MKTNHYLVDGKVNLKDYNAGLALDLGKDAAKEAFSTNVGKLQDLQELLYAEQKHRILVVLQATDTAGKDSTIRQVFGPLNPQGVKVTSFKKPTEEELAHDYLWRVHPHVPGNGEIAVFNRSHYEDVLVVRVHNYVPEKVWKQRYDQITDFEKYLANTGTTILKFFLNISMDEQAKRLQERLNDPTKHWKFKVGDLAERKLWDEYQHAYEDAMEKTSTSIAPWFIIPANHKWVRNYVISEILVDALEGLKMQYPPTEPGLDKIVIE